MTKIKDSKFVPLFEYFLSRYQQGGFLTGDVVKFRKNALNHEDIKNNEPLKEMIKRFMELPITLRISAIKTKRANTATNIMGGADAPTGFYADVIEEINPGMWINPVTVPLDVLEKIEIDNNLPPVSDELKRKSKIELDGKAGDVPQTKLKDQTLPTKNTKLDHGNKWSDEKPGAGGAKKDLKKPDEVK